MVWAWAHWQPCALGTRTLSCFGHGRIANRMLSEHERYHALGMGMHLPTVCSRNTNVIMVWAWAHRQPYALGTRTLSRFGHGCSGNRMLLEHERYHGLGMGASPTVCSWNTNIIMVWACMVWQPYALGTRTLSCFGHGRIANHMLSEHERYHGLGMDALATVCSWNTNVITVWAWAHRQPYALGTRTLSWFGHACSGNRMLLEHERYHALGMGASPTVCSRNTNVIMVWAWAHRQPYALGTRTLSWFGHACSGNRMLSEHERYHGLGMGASPTICSRNTNVITVWAWMLWQPYALGTRTLSWFGHGRIANRMLLEHERYHGLGMHALATVCSRNTNVIMVWAWAHRQPYALGTRTLSRFGHGCSGNRMLLEHERYHGLGMHALATVCSRNTNVIMLWAWAHRQPYALGTRTLSRFGHGCSGNRMLLEHERYHGLGMHALATVCSRNTNVIMVWAWAHRQPYALGTRTLSCFGHGRIANRMLSEHERYHALGMGASPTVCSRNTNVFMLWAWAHRQPYALGTRTLSCFGHGRIANRMLSEHERYHALGMAALATLCSWNTNVIMVWAWPLWQAHAPPACCALILTRCRAVVDASTSGARSTWPPLGAGVSRVPHMALQVCAKLEPTG